MNAKLIAFISEPISLPCGVAVAAGPVSEVGYSSGASTACKFWLTKRGGD